MLALAPVAPCASSPQPACAADAAAGAKGIEDLFEREQLAEEDMDTFLGVIDRDVEAYSQRRLSLKPELRPTSGFVRRLKAEPSGAAYDRELPCLMPVAELGSLSRRHSFDRDLLSLELKPGRACAHHELCTSRCGVHFRDGVITRDEAAQLVAHGRSALRSEGALAHDARWPYVRVDFMRSASNGSHAGHLLSLRVAERLRRLAAEIFEVPLARLGVAETLLALRRVVPGGGGGSVEEVESSYHCDESLSPHFHFSSIVWLSTQHDDFEGGELAFVHDDQARRRAKTPWLLVEPSAGRAAFFSSGWENVHGVKPLRRGERWALSVPFMVSDELLGIAGARRDDEAGGRAARGAHFRALCVRPADKYAYAHCRGGWAANLTVGVGVAASPGS